MKLPTRGDEIIYTDKHPYHGGRGGEVFGIVHSRQGGILNITLASGDIDRVYWVSADGEVNPFYEARSSINKS